MANQEQLDILRQGPILRKLTPGQVVGITGKHLLHPQFRIPAKKVNFTHFNRFFVCLLCSSSKLDILICKR